MKQAIINGKIITKNNIINGGVVFENGKITYAGASPDTNGCDITDALGRYISPGFVDIHCHGGGDADFMDGTEDAFRTVLATHAAHGTTSMLATTLSGSNAELEAVFDTYHKLAGSSYRGSKLLGIHLEGPYVNPSQAGAQDPKYIKAPQKDDYESIYTMSGGAIKRWTAAPELEGCDEFGKFLKSHGILASIGHTDACYSDVLKAYENGFEMMTHFYSAMSTITRRGGFRIPGAIESGYIISDMKVELIADGCHLPPEMLNMVYKLKGADNIALVTDAMRCAGTDASQSILGSRENGQLVLIEDGVAKMPDRQSFAGSIATTDRLVRTAYKNAGIPLADAVKMASFVPGSILGKNCCIENGADADILMFDDNINISAVYINGVLQ